MQVVGQWIFNGRLTVAHGSLARCKILEAPFWPSGSWRGVHFRLLKGNRKPVSDLDCLVFDSLRYEATLLILLAAPPYSRVFRPGTSSYVGYVAGHP
jgi:hypothetical protein